MIVDDGSTDVRGRNPIAISQVEVVEGDGSFFHRRHNVCIQAALKYDPKYILLINDDAVFDSHFFLYGRNCGEAREISDRISILSGHSS